MVKNSSLNCELMIGRSPGVTLIVCLINNKDSRVPEEGLKRESRTNGSCPATVSGDEVSTCHHWPMAGKDETVG